jgi:diguanylate cyclase (GGDEF)-like protein
MLKQQYELQLVNEQLLVEAQHDTLTGLPNRSYMNSYAGELMEKALKNNESFGIEIIDIDYFKQINDRYGHMSGDKYLVSMAEILQKIIAEYDDVFTARYGGDEFVVIYYGKTNEQVGEIMAQIKAYAMLVPISDRDVTGSGYLTLSQGCFNKVPKKLNRLWDYFSEADITLYDVKKSGRNGHRLRVEFGKNNV